MKTIVIALVYFVCIYTSVAQVGIGTIVPTSELEIATTNTGIPALELNPQSAPIGTITGQLAVIGDELYMYDGTRAKWLTTGAVALQFASSGNVNTQGVRFGGNMNHQGVGPLMATNGTIVALTATTFSNPTKSFELRVRDYNPVSGLIVTTQSYTFNLTNYEYVNSNLNINFNTNDFITMKGDVGGNASNPVVIIWVKWRK